MKQAATSGNTGQTMVEIIIVIGITLLLVTGLVSATTSSLKAGNFSRAKSQANKYAQEGVELTRALRDSSWLTFSQYSGNYCLNAAGVFSSSETCNVNIDGKFSRSVNFSWQNPKMVVVVRVRWRDQLTAHQSELTTYFTQWK